MAKFQDTRLILESQFLFYMPAKKKGNLNMKTQHHSLTGVGQLGGCCPTQHKVAGLTPGRGTCRVLGWVSG